MPFSVCSAPEVWQHIMHKNVDDLEGVEVIAGLGRLPTKYIRVWKRMNVPSLKSVAYGI